jgi:hypothetical protein
MIDTLPSCLSYGDDATVTYTDSEGEETELSITPSMADTVDGGLELTWDIGSEIGLFAPDETIAIEYSATAIELGENINYADGSALCTYDDSINVTDSDSATVNVMEEPTDVIPEDVMSVFLSGYGECYCSGEECTSTLVITSFGAQDLSGGSYPITNVTLEVDGVEKFNSGAISTTLYNNTALDPIKVDECEVPYNVDVTATNALGLDLTYSGIIIPELILSALINATATLPEEGPCSASVSVRFEAHDLSGGEYPIVSVELLKNDETVDVTEITNPDFIQIHNFSSECGVTHSFWMEVTNSNEQSVIATYEFTIPNPSE